MKKDYDFSGLTENFDAYLKKGVLPYYDFAVMKDGECVYRHMNGFTDIENKIRPDGKELFNLYSCSKLITCVAALMLWEEGKYNFDDRLSDYMPEFEKMSVLTDNGLIGALNPITIRHLFTMTAGFSYDVFSPSLKKCFEDTNGACPTVKAIEYLSKEPLLFEPGTRWEYSLCHDVLAALVEVLSGERFARFVNDRIFVPLKMTDSYFNGEFVDKERLIKQYRLDPETKKLCEVDKGNVLQIGKNYDSGGAGCISTVDDYLKFEEALRTGALLKSDTLKLLTTNALTEKQAETYWLKDNYGYGFGQRCPKDDLRSDFGWDGMAGSYYAIDIENGISVFFGTHVIGCVEFNMTRPEIIQAVKDCLLLNK